MSGFARGFAAAYLLAAIYAGALFYKARYDTTMFQVIRAGILWPVSGAGIFMVPRAGPPVGSHEPCGEEETCAG